MREHLAFKHYLNFVFFSVCNFILHFCGFMERKTFIFFRKMKIKRNKEEKENSHIVSWFRRVNEGSLNEKYANG